MKRIAYAYACSIAVFASSFAVAQEQLPLGRYSGTYQSSQGTTVSIRLTLTSVENGIVKGVGERSSTARGGGQCSGEYPMEGTLKSNELNVRGELKGTPSGDCTFRLRATVEGGKLNARVGTSEFVMSK